MTELSKNEQYGITRQTVANLSALRNCFKNVSIDFIDEVLGKINSIKEEKEAEFRQFETEAVEKNAKRLQAVALLEEAGLPIPPEFLQDITAELLATGQVSTKKKKGKAKPSKARLAWKNPQTGEWNVYSRGRTANWIAIAKESGETDETLALYADEYNKEMGFE